MKLLKLLRERDRQVIDDIAKSALAIPLFGLIGFAYFEIRSAEAPPELKHILELILSAIILAFGLSWILWRSQNAIRASQRWGFDALKRKVESLEQAPATSEVAADPARWPWGGHHTEALGHLEAAALRFWSLYDPADSSTAPTNEMVSEWLREERGVSKEKAQAIASLLRADGLKAGPRR